MFGTEQGMVKKTSMSLYDRSRRDGLIAINLKEDDNLIAVRRVKQGERVMMVSSAGKAIPGTNLRFARWAAIPWACVA